MSSKGTPTKHSTTNTKCYLGSQWAMEFTHVGKNIRMFWNHKHLWYFTDTGEEYSEPLCYQKLKWNVKLDKLEPHLPNVSFAGRLPTLPHPRTTLQKTCEGPQPAPRFTSTCKLKSNYRPGSCENIYIFLIPSLIQHILNSDFRSLNAFCHNSTL